MEVVSIALDTRHQMPSFDISLTSGEQVERELHSIEESCTLLCTEVCVGGVGEVCSTVSQCPRSEGKSLPKLWIERQLL